MRGAKANDTNHDSLASMVAKLFIKVWFWEISQLDTKNTLGTWYQSLLHSQFTIPSKFCVGEIFGKFPTRVPFGYQLLIETYPSVPPTQFSRYMTTTLWCPEISHIFGARSFPMQASDLKLTRIPSTRRDLSNGTTHESIGLIVPEIYVYGTYLT